MKEIRKPAVIIMMIVRKIFWVITICPIKKLKNLKKRRNFKIWPKKY